ncbi:MAG TPA: hypothetical protein IAB60_12165 [Candidatus Caccovicinus merdipullorum]|uniref:Uncharacterized protein n=1 Tax=Candidatus Caccovicinus merdipullorum TaxID=2840724 RepID=A0A9D1GLA7_9FIRM|nr:hypothetical protein [Candidatus Caccovicinus merdipullorum]
MCCCNGCNWNNWSNWNSWGSWNSRSCCGRQRLNQAFLSGFQNGFQAGFREGLERDDDNGCGSCCQWNRSQNSDCGCCD